MKNFIVKVLLLLSIIFLSHLPTQSQNIQIEQSIRSFEKGIQGKNIQIIKKNFAEGAQWQGFNTYHFAVENFGELFTRYESIKLERKKLETYPIDNRIASIVSYKFSTIVTKGSSEEFPVEFVFLWERFYDNWKIVAINPVILKPISNNIETEIQSIATQPINSSQEVQKINLIADSHVYSYNYSNWNKADWGAYEVLGAGYNNIGGEKRSFLKFDLGNIRAGEVNKAVLRLYHYHTGGTSDLELGVYRVNEAWVEGDGTYKPHSDAAGGELCWENQPMVDMGPFATFSPGGGTKKWIEIDITPMIMQWLTGAANNGVMIKGVGNFSNIIESQYGFYSKEHDDPDLRPALLIYPSNMGGGVILTDPNNPDVVLTDPSKPDIVVENPNEPHQNEDDIDPNSNISDQSLGKILWTHTLPDENVGIIAKTFGGDLGTRMALGLDGSIYYAAGGGRATWVPTKLYAVNKEDGSLKWKTEKLDAASLNSHIMVGDDGTIYAIGQTNLYAFDPDNGQTKWTWAAPDKIGKIPTKSNLNHLALKRDGNIVIAAGNGAVYSIDKNGNLLWHDLDPAASSYAMSIGPDGTIFSLNNLYRPNYDGSLYLIARDPDTGTKKWTHKTAGGIGGGNNIAFDANGNLIASFRDIGDTQNRLHRMDPTSGKILWSSDFASGLHGLYIGPDSSAYQHLAPPGEKSGMYRIHLSSSDIELVNWSLAFGAIDNKNRLIHTFTDAADNNRKKLGAFSMDGTVDWKVEDPGVDDRTFLISNDNIIYTRINNNQVVAIKSDAPLASSAWPRLGSDNRNTFRSNTTDPIKTANTTIVPDHSAGNILWTHDLPDEKVGIIAKTFGGDLGARMALGLDGSIYYAASGGRATWVPTKLYAVNKNDGILNWKTEELDAAVLNSHIMVGDDGTIYAIGQTNLYAFEPDNGKTKWTWTAPDKIGKIPTKSNLNHMSLKNDGNIVVAAGNGAVYSIDKNGNLLWYDLDPAASSYAMSIGPDGNIFSLNNLYRPDFDGGFYLIARDPDTGVKKWTHKTSGGTSGGNNIAFDANGDLIASFRNFGETQRRLHRLDPASGKILWSGDFTSGQGGLYIGPDNYAYQYLSPPGKKAGIYRNNMKNSDIELVNWSSVFGAMDSKNRLIHHFTDTTDKNKVKLGAFNMDGIMDWKVEVPGIDVRTFLISEDGVIYGRINANQIVAIQNDATLAKGYWPRLGSDNQNTFRARMGGTSNSYINKNDVGNIGDDVILSKTSTSAMAGQWNLYQSNGYNGSMTLQQNNSGRITGTAIWNGYLKGTIDGAIIENTIEFNITYPNGDIGVYKGVLTPDGTKIINGTAKGNNGVSANWNASRGSAH